jgi:dTMP kinase
MVITRGIKDFVEMERFITFEGIEGCGKTTQIKLAGEFLKQRNIPSVMTLEPGGTSIGKRIREMLLNKDPYEKTNKLCAETELLLFSAARAQHVREVILPALRRGDVVLCDRFYDATLAYQGFGRELDIRFIEELIRFSTGSLKPGLTLLFDLPVEAGLKRARDRIFRIKESGTKPSTDQLELDLITAEDEFEQEDLEFHGKVRDGYLSIVKNEPDRFRIVDASRNIKTIHQEVCSHLLSFIKE